MKYPLLLSLLCCMTAGRAAQPVKTLRCDFSYGIPAGFTLIDNDRNTPSPDKTEYYTIDGRRLPTAPNHGIVVTRGADGSRTKICCK